MNAAQRRKLPRIAAALLVVAACAPDPGLGEQEEIGTPSADVPTAAQVTVARIAGQLGLQPDAWYWDTENLDWECVLSGLPRHAELDIGADGGFHEFELRYTLEEIEAELPDVAAFIQRQCRGEPGTDIELSLRRESLLQPLLGLTEAWTQSGVAIEFQCANGRDFEIDANLLVAEQRLDDVGEQDPSGSDGR